MNVLGEGQPDVQDPARPIQFLFTRGSAGAGHGAEAGYILERLAEYSRPFGTQIDIKGETAESDVKK
jgi:hypothetical protein